MSIANWEMKMGGKRIWMDAYFSRVPQDVFVAPPGLPNDPNAFTRAPQRVDMDSIRKVRDAALGGEKLDLLLVGHSHWDHSWDTPTWAKLTGAPMIGGISTCMQAVAQGVPAAGCRSVNGGEKFDLGDGVTMRVVRWNHSGDSSNPIQHFLVVPVIRPKHYIPNHWDGLFNAFWPGMPYPFKDEALQAYSAAGAARAIRRRCRACPGPACGSSRSAC